MRHLNYKYLLLTPVLIILFLSCTPAGYFSSSPKKTAPEATGDDVMLLIEQGRFYEAEKELVPRIVSNPDDPLPKKQLSLVYFKTENYPSAEKLIRSLLQSNPGIFSMVTENFEFDLYYIFTTSLIRQNKLNTVAEYFYLVADRDGLSKENRLKYDLMLIEFDYRSEQLDIADERIRAVLTEHELTQDQKLNLYYLLSSSEISLNKLDSSLENAIFLILNDYDFKYSRKIKRLLDGIVNNATEDQLERLRPKITDGYRELAARSVDNTSLKEKILRAVNTLENTEVTIEMRENGNNGSYINYIKIFPDKDITAIYISSKDSINYVNPPLYDGKTLTLRIPGKQILSKDNSSAAPPGSGVESLKWEFINDTLELKINLTENLNITLERAFGEEFEKNDNLKDRHSLKINVYLPEQAYAQVAEPDDGGAKYTIVLDPGHGGDDPGALSVMKKKDGSRYTEKEMNLMLCKGLKQYLEERGYRVFLTRDGDYYPSLHERNRIAQNRNADMFLSVHLNSASSKNKKYWQSDRYYGAEMIVRNSLGKMPEFINFQAGNRQEWMKLREKALAQHKKLSNILSKTIPGSLEKPFNAKRKVKPKNLVIFSGMTIPHALIEAGFIINNKTLNYLLSDDGQDDFFEGVYNGVEEYRKGAY
ncbi:MAG: N-acetylmuramoyl-L-alanine amidase [Candidatus Delongbacteria bacterium]|nr:N-acetylmuramoyl-L-alanine amidase [Candidatus Delongbacteria bacterium]